MDKICALGTLLLLFVLTFSSVRAQSNYVEGYVVNLRNDTVRGLIDDKNWEKNPKTISFKSLKTGEIIKYHPIDLAGFYIKPAHEYYKSYHGKVDDSVDESGKLIGVATDAEFFQKDYAKEDTIFIRTLLKGVLSLYTHTDKKGRLHFFVEKEGFPVVELVNQEYLIDQPKNYTSMTWSQLIRTNKVYRKQLQEMLADCDNVNQQIKNTSYTERSLLKIFNNYYKCTHRQATYEHRKEGPKFEIGVMAGVSASSLRAISSYGTRNYGTSINPMAGLSFNFIFPRNRGAWSLYGDVLWRQFGFTKDVATLTDTVPSKLSSSYLKFDLLLRYTLPTKSQKIRPFINVGWANNLELYSDQNIFRYSTGTGYKYETRKHERGLLAGIGLRSTKLQCEIRYERGNGMSPLVGMSSQVHNWYLLLSYQLK
jgi:hypothetical protein